MSATNAVSFWLEQLKGGDRDSVQKLWEFYQRRLVGLARKKLQGKRRLPADEEDVALSAFYSFCKGVERGRFPDLRDRNNLWSLLVYITAQKVYNLVQRESRQKRGGGKVRGESALLGSSDSDQGGIAQIVGREPTPAFALQIAEEFEQLLNKLPSDELRSVALWKMEGYTNAEIAAKLDCAEGTVERRLRVIRSIWSG